MCVVDEVSGGSYMEVRLVGVYLRPGEDKLMLDKIARYECVNSYKVVFGYYKTVIINLIGMQCAIDLLYDLQYVIDHLVCVVIKLRGSSATGDIAKEALQHIGSEVNLLVVSSDGMFVRCPNLESAVQVLLDIKGVVE